MSLMPPTLVDLATSKKAVTLWVVIALWMPAIHGAMGLSEEALTWITIAYCAYALSQGLADFGEAKNGQQ
jgi:hypothetical protein